MIETISCDTLQAITNPDFRRYAQRYADIELQTLAAIENFGLPFNRSAVLQQQNQVLRQQLAADGATFANNGKSIHLNWLSSACTACRTGEGSYTTFLSLKCHRDCYFCFNPNQEGYDYYQQQRRDASGEIAQLAQMAAPLTHVALTGGEPLLHRTESIAFFNQLRQQLPQVHSRLYTAGDPLDRATALKLQQAGLQEIRFSIKIDDPAERQQKVLQRIALAREYLPSVMVEMPVLPGTQAQMETLLLALDKLGVDGINLLEFCFPLHNGVAYRQRGFALKYPPYEVYYNYWYAGGLAVAESENLCLQLLQFAQRQQLTLGVHYCSLENKHTGQVYQQNHDYPGEKTLQLSSRDAFLKTAKAFGEDCLPVQTILQRQGAPFSHRLQHGYIQFHPQSIPLLRMLDIELCLSSYIVEQDASGELLLKEVRLAKTTPAGFDPTDV